MGQCPKSLKAMQTEPYTIPLFINLPALQDPTKNAILQALQQYGWDTNTIAYFKLPNYNNKLPLPSHTSTPKKRKKRLNCSHPKPKKMHSL